MISRAMTGRIATLGAGCLLRSAFPGSNLTCHNQVLVSLIICTLWRFPQVGSFRTRQTPVSRMVGEQHRIHA